MFSPLLLAHASLSVFNLLLVLLLSSSLSSCASLLWSRLRLRVRFFSRCLFRITPFFFFSMSLSFFPFFSFLFPSFSPALFFLPSFSFLFALQPLLVWSAHFFLERHTVGSDIHHVCCASCRFSMLVTTFPLITVLRFKLFKLAGVVSATPFDPCHLYSSM